MPVDPLVFKQVMRRFATGVMVLTVKWGEEMHAMTVNAVTSVSLNPTLMLVCIEKNAHSHELVKSTGQFALNILSAAQRELGERFAFDREARFHPLDFAKGHMGVTGGLLIDGSLGYLECRVVSECEGGDHTIFVAEVIESSLDGDEDDPLLYYGGRFISLSRKELT